MLDAAERISRQRVLAAIERKKVDEFKSLHEKETGKVRALVEERRQVEREIELQAEAKMTEEVRQPASQASQRAMRQRSQLCRA